MPKRIQRKRTKGFKLPPQCIYVGRPSRWGNPYRVGQSTDDLPMWLVGPYGIGRLTETIVDAQQAVDLYRVYIKRMIKQNPYTYDLNQITGHDLACWCKLVDGDGNPVPCHADVLLDIANPRAASRQIGDRVWIAPGASFGASRGEWATIIDWPSNQPNELMPCPICDNPDCWEFGDLVTDDDRSFFHVSECQMFDTEQGA